MIYPVLIIVVATLLGIFIERRIIRGVGLFGYIIEDTRGILNVIQVIPYLLVLKSVEMLFANYVDLTLKYTVLAFVITIIYMYGVLRMFSHYVKRPKLQKDVNSK